MKIEVEFRSDMSRAETFRALRITLEAATRLAHRMTVDDLQKIENFGAALIAAAEHERARRGPRQNSNFIEFANGDGRRDRGGPPRLAP